MMQQTVTIYNYYKDGNEEKWKRTVLKNCNYSFSHDKTVGSNGEIVISELITVIIPYDKNYVEFPEFNKLEDKGDKWTINPMKNLDVIICQECSEDIDTISAFRKEHLKCGVIAGFSDNTVGDLLKHYKVVAK